jgi:hypothetical protein
MSGVSLPVTRPIGRAIIVGHPSCRTAPSAALSRLGFVCTESDHPYDGMLQLCRRPLFYSAMILCLHSLYREELALIASIKRRFTHVEIWLADTDGRQAALAEAMRLGADGLVDDEGLHRIGAATIPPPVADQPPAPSEPAPPVPHTPADTLAKDVEDEITTKAPGDPAAAASTDPLLTAEELRALLQETHNPRVN